MKGSPTSSSEGEARSRSGFRARYTIHGARRANLTDLYYFLLTTSWWRLLLLAFAGYLAINALFALFYWLGGNAITDAQPGSFLDAFFFSVQTFSTIGYGAMRPASLYTHGLVILESFAGLIAVAVGTGIIFAKFSRPAARVTFSKHMVVNARDGQLTLQFRIANERKTPIYNARLRAELLIEEETVEGRQMRRFHSLRLEREELPYFLMTWTGIHLLDQDSPLTTLKEAERFDKLVLILAWFEGRDSATLQTVQAQRIYRRDDVFSNHEFGDILRHDASGRTSMRIDEIDRIRPTS